MARVTLTTKTTDQAGVTGHQYTGTGAGTIEILAVSGGVRSKPVQFLDCYYYDPATSDNSNNSYYKSDAYVTRTLDQGGTTAKNTHTSTTKYYYAAMNGTTPGSAAATKQFNNCIMEIDIIEYTGGSIAIYGLNNSVRNFSAEGEAPFTLRLKGENGLAYRWDGEDWVQMSSSTTTGDIGFRIGLPTGVSVKFSNWRIYKI